jgi:glycosyltransferase involved in cell wall biosynthesis
MRHPVTVLITVRNNASTIKQCLESILRQTFKNYDVYVVDAFSTDGTYEILKSFGKKIRLEQLKGNPPTAYNYAIDRINSKFIAFTNGDCVVERDWLEEILKPFSDNKVVAVAGNVKNPKKSETKLQEIIGRELEYRYKAFPKELSRAPEMNLCLRTEVIKKLKFDDSLNVSYDTDLGYRLIKSFKKIAYQKNAIIYHYHRPSWKGYFKQQYTYAKYASKVYLEKHREKMLGDEISKTNMLFQIIFLYLISLNILLLPFSQFLFNTLSLLIIILFISYFFDIIKLARSFVDVFWFLTISIVRNIAWNVGIFVGIIKLLQTFFSRDRRNF